MGFPERNGGLGFPGGPGVPGARCGKKMVSCLEISLTSTLMSSESAWIWWTAGGAAAVLACLWWWVWSKGRPFAGGDVFRASRLSAGNHLFPTQVLVTPSSVVQYTPRWIGREEESIHLAHVASVKIDTHALLSDLLI